MLKFNLLFGILLAASTIWAQTPQTTTEHGYRFYHHVKKNGQKPKRGESIRAHVDVFIGDTLLSSSSKNPGGMYKFDIAPQGENLDHYPPLMDASLLMGIGDSATIYQPLDSIMRSFIPPAYRKEKDLRFEIRMMQIVSLEEKGRMQRAMDNYINTLKQTIQRTIDDYNSGALSSKLNSTPSGLKMLVAENGNGRPIEAGETVQAHYFGYLKDGKSFGNSFESRQPIAFPAGVGQMIPGFDEGVMTLKHGSKAYLFVPSALGYGDQEASDGLIPPNSDLIFYLEIQ